MKKYEGKKDYSESLYYVQASTYPGLPKGFYYEGYQIGPIPFDYEFGFNDVNDFKDMNDFTQYSEIFNIYQFSKI